MAEVNSMLAKAGVEIGNISSQAVTTVWENCTQENLDKITQAVKTTDETLKQNGIDVSDLACQAGSAVAQATVLLAGKMWEDSKLIMAQAYG